MTEAQLLARARRVYELGRIRGAALGAAGVTPLTLLPVAHCAALGRAGEAIVGACAAAFLLGLFLWRGESFARGAKTGLVAGFAPLLLPTLASATGILCSATLCGVLPVAAVAGGVVAGWVLVRRPAVGATRLPFWFSAVAMTGCLGAMGCLHIGMAGLAATGVGILAGAAPALCWRLAVAGR